MILVKPMKKMIILFLLIFITASCGTKKTVMETEQNSYYPINNENAKFKYVNSDAFVYHNDLSKKVQFNNKTYQVRHIRYSWGKEVETFYRMENGNVLYYDTKSEKENIMMPKKPVIGFKWINSDKSWEYEIIELEAELETPAKKYSNLLVIRATQLTNRDQTKLAEYLNYYKQNLGKVASIGNGKLMTYRVE